MPATSSSGCTSLSRKPLAPACRAAYTYSSMSNVVSMTTRAWHDGSAAIRRVAAMPSTPGIRTSIRTTSGLSRRHLGHRLVTVRRLPHHVHVRLDLQDHPEPGPHQGLVVDDQHADRAKLGASAAFTPDPGEAWPPARSRPRAALGPTANRRTPLLVPACPAARCLLPPVGPAAPPAARRRGRQARSGRAEKSMATSAPPGFRACRSVLVSPSWTSRYAVRSSPGGSSRTAPVTDTDTGSPELRNSSASRST